MLVIQSVGGEWWLDQWRVLGEGDLGWWLACVEAKDLMLEGGGDGHGFGWSGNSDNGYGDGCIVVGSISKSLWVVV